MMPEPDPYGDRLCLPMAFDVDRLRTDLDTIEACDWTAHFVQHHYAGDWSVVPLRAPAGVSHPILRIAANPGTTGWVDTEFLDAAPYLRTVLAQFHCPIQGARLMRLGPGSVIREHRDPDLGVAWGCARLHVPIRTSAAVDFRLNGTRIDMAPGSVWYLRLSDPHGVTNAGIEDRVHLVIDVQVNDWLVGLLSSALSSPCCRRGVRTVAPDSAPA